MKMKRFGTFMANAWQPITLTVIALACLFLFLVFRLGSLVGLDSGELLLRHAVTNDHYTLMSLLRDASFLPYKLGLYILQFLPFHGAGSIRVIGVLWAMLGSWGMYYLLRRWHTERVAIFGTALFVTSSWLLHTARYASPATIYSAGIALIALWMWLHNAAHRRIALLSFCTASVLALYVPGFAWFLLPAVFWQRHNLVHAFRRVSMIFGIITLTVSFLLVIPLIVSIAWPLAGSSSMHEFYMFSGIPEHLPTVHQFLHNLATVWGNIFFKSDGNPVFFVGHLPIVSMVGGIMCLIGIVVFATNYKLDRARMIFASLIVASILVALGGTVQFTILLPFVYLVFVEGVTRLLQEWLTVFPRNPIARGVGISLISALVVGIMAYQVMLYFVAWPHTPATKAAFSRKI